MNHSSLPNIVNTKRVAMWSILALGYFFAAFLFGLLGAVGGWFIQLFIITLAVPIVLMLLDYRIGLVFAILLLPYSNSPLVPKLGPLSIMNVLILGVCLAFLLRWILYRLAGKELVIPISSQLIWFYIIPIVLANMIGTLHLGEIAKQYLESMDISSYGLKEYWISSLFKMMLLVAIGCIVSASVVERGSGRLFVLVTILSAVIFVFASATLMLASGASLEQLRHARGFLEVLGNHNNQAGWLLQFAFPVALFSQRQVANRLARSALMLATITIAVGIVITFSRGAFVSMLAVLALFVWHSKRFGTGLAIVTIAAASILMAPEAIKERLMTGLGEESISDQLISGRLQGDDLTAGRVWGWRQLAPEIFRSPISLLVGRGVSSTQWSAAARDGRYIANHPHSLYLEILMDLGVLGAVAIFAFYYYVWRLFRNLSIDDGIDPYMRGYFLGAIGGMIGMFIFGLSSGHYFPATEQIYFWVSIGLALGYKRLQLVRNVAEMRTKSGRRQLPV